jgi:hypothetical protein
MWCDYLLALMILVIVIALTVILKHVLSKIFSNIGKGGTDDGI